MTGRIRETGFIPATEAAHPDPGCAKKGVETLSDQLKSVNAESKAGKLALIYLTAGCVWILATSLWLGDFSLERFRYFEVAKGLAFVSVTALLMYGLLKKWEGNMNAANRRIHQLAYSDGMTGLPNAHSFWETLQRAVTEGRSFLLLILRISRFEEIQDVYGRKQGMAFVAAVAERLKGLVDRGVFVSQTESDTFHLIVRLEGDVREETILRTLEQRLQQPFRFGEDELTPAFHIGTARYPGDGTDGELLVHCAYRSLARARESGVLYIREQAPDGMESARRRLFLEKELKKALARGEFTQHFQPKINIETGETAGFEALIRWNHPALGPISPAEFIPIAEESGDIVAIGKWMLHEACRQAKRLQDTQQCFVPVSVNVSARQFWQNIVGVVESALDDAGLDPEYLVLELTESLMINPESAVRILTRLKTLGVKLSIDDFGTGFSSLAYLKRLPIDELKVDKSFIDEILTDSPDRRIVQSLIVLAHHLNMTVVAEGVEKKEQVDCLRDLGCDQVQGYYYARPMTGEQLAAFLADGGNGQADPAGSAVLV